MRTTGGIINQVASSIKTPRADPMPAPSRAVALIE
jgi:hypothetical protein